MLKGKVVFISLVLIVLTGGLYAEPYPYAPHGIDFQGEVVFYECVNEHNRQGSLSIVNNAVGGVEFEYDLIADRGVANEKGWYKRADMAMMNLQTYEDIMWSLHCAIVQKELFSLKAMCYMNHHERTAYEMAQAIYNTVATGLEMGVFDSQLEFLTAEDIKWITEDFLLKQFNWVKM